MAIMLNFVLEVYENFFFSASQLPDSSILSRRAGIAVSVTNHMTGPDPLLVNKQWYDSMPADLQQIFDEVAVEAMDWYFEAARKAEDELLQELSKTMTVNYLDDAGLASFVDAVQPVYDASVEKGYFTAAQIEEARAIVEACGS